MVCVLIKKSQVRVLALFSLLLNRNISSATVVEQLIPKPIFTLVQCHT